MSVTTGNNNGPAQTTMGNALQDAGVTRPSSTPSGQHQRAGIRSGGPTGLSINARRPRPISRFGFSESATKYLKAFQDSFKESVKDAEAGYEDLFRFHILDHTNLSTPLSLICEVMTVADNEGKKHAGTFTYVIAASNAKLPNRFIPYGNNQQVEVDVVPGDVINTEMWGIIESYLRTQYGNDVAFYNAGAAVLPRDMSPESQADIGLALYHGTQALYTILGGVIGTEEPLNVKMFQGYTVQGTVNLSPPPTATLGGLPVRNDLAIELNYLTRAQGLTGINSEVSNGLTRVGGYVDLEFVGNGVAAPVQNYGFQPFQQIPTQQYAPRYVITDLDTRTDAVALEDILLGLYSSTMVTQNWTWARPFEPRLGRKKNETDMRDIGALGYVINFGDPTSTERKRVPTTGTFSQADLFKLISFAVHDQAMISIDIDETGTLSWVHQYFIAAANGVESAYRQIVTAADNLTNNVFSKNWDNSPIIRDDFNRVHLGYFIGNDGERHDLREIDRLAILNLFGDRDMEVVYAWDRSWNDLNIPLELRLETRAKIFKNSLPGVEITGYARRATFTTKFLTVLAHSIAQAGLMVQQTNMTMITQTGQQRPLYNMADVALQNQAFGGGFTFAGNQGYSGFRSGGSTFLGRFGDNR